MNGNDVIRDMFETVTVHSWTWARMTTDEKSRFISIDFSTIKGTEARRREIYCTIYAAFLAGLGYNGPFWRENEAVSA